MKLILDPASCKPIFIAPQPPFSSLPTQQHVLHLRELYITHSVGNERQLYSSLQQGVSSYRLLSASIFLVRACRHTSASCLCFAQMSRVSLSFIITFCMVTSCDYFFRRQRTSFNRTQPALWRERLPLGTTERWPGATRLKVSVRTLLLLFSACRGWPLLDNERTPIVSIFFGHAASSSPKFRTCTDISVRIFSEKSKNFLRKFER